jgi:Flp pilus assembly protein TadG
VRRTLLTRAARCDRGTAAIEFAIISVVLISLCIGIVDFGRTLYVKNQLSFLADQATRAVLINPAVTSATLQTDLTSNFTAGDPNQLNVTITAETVGGQDYRVITVAYPITLFIPNLASSTINLDVTRRVPNA